MANNKYWPSDSSVTGSFEKLKALGTGNKNQVEVEGDRETMGTLSNLRGWWGTQRRSS